MKTLLGSLSSLLSLVVMGLVVTWIFFPSVFSKIDYREASAPINLSSDTWTGGCHLGLTPDKVARVNLNTFNETNLLYYSRIRMNRTDQALFLDKMADRVKTPSGNISFEHAPKWLPDRNSLRYIGLVEDNKRVFHLFTDDRDYLYMRSS